MFFIEKKQDGVRCIKTDNWYVVLTPVGDGENQAFNALYYKDGLSKLKFEVSDTYSISGVKEIEQEAKEAKLEEGEIKRIINKMKRCFTLLRRMDKVEEIL